MIKQFPKSFKQLSAAPPSALKQLTNKRGTQKLHRMFVLALQVTQIYTHKFKRSSITKRQSHRHLDRRSKYFTRTPRNKSKIYTRKHAALLTLRRQLKLITRTMSLLLRQKELRRMLLISNNLPLQSFRIFFSGHYSGSNKKKIVC